MFNEKERAEYLRRLEKPFVDKVALFRKKGIVSRTLCPIEKKGIVKLYVEVERFLILEDEYFDELWHDFYKFIPHEKGRLMEGTVSVINGMKCAFVLNDENIFDIAFL